MSEGVFTFRVEQTDNGSLVASLHREVANQTLTSLTAGSGYYNRYRHRYHHFERIQDDVGALYYVVAVILIYGCSILMMIASYIRKNKVRNSVDQPVETVSFGVISLDRIRNAPWRISMTI